MLVIETVAMAGAALASLNNVIKQVNETGKGVNQLFGLVSDFGESLNNFEHERRTSTFKSLTQAEMLQLAQIRKSYERRWKEIEDMLAMFDPSTLEELRSIRNDQAEKRKEMIAMAKKKEAAKKKLMTQISVGLLTLVVGGLICGMAFYIVLGVFK